MIYNGTKVRRLPRKFQVDTCKTKKKERVAHVQLHQAMIYNVARVRQKFQVDTCKSKEDRSAHEQLLAHLVVEIQAMIYDAVRVRRLSTKFQDNTYNIKRDISTHGQLRTL